MFVQTPDSFSFRFPTFWHYKWPRECFVGCANSTFLFWLLSRDRPDTRQSLSFTIKIPSDDIMFESFFKDVYCCWCSSKILHCGIGKFAFLSASFVHGMHTWCRADQPAKMLSTPIRLTCEAFDHCSIINTKTLYARIYTNTLLLEQVPTSKW